MNLPRTPMGIRLRLAACRSAAPAGVVCQTEVGRRQGRARLGRRAGARAGVEAVILDPGQDLAALARGAAAGGADALGVAGGDGSLAVVAAVAAAHGIAFACIPAV